MEFFKIYPKKGLVFFFYGYGFKAFKYFVIDNDAAIINKIFYNLNKFNKKGNKITIISLKFFIEAHHKLKEKEIDKLTNTTKDFSHLLSEFGKVNSVSNEVAIYMVGNALQKKYFSSCRVFQLYFYKNLFDPKESSEILTDEYLTKNSRNFTK